MPAIRPLVLSILLALAAGHAAAAPLPKPDRGGVPASALYDYGVMGPPATPAIVAEAQAELGPLTAPGPFTDDWDSLQRNYRPPAWFQDAKFGIFMHWGLYAVPAHHNEWYEKHMYDTDLAWHTEHFGAPARFGYKDFIPLFTQRKFDPAQWAALFRRAGAKLVLPSAQHHDNFAMWASGVTPFNALRMGPKRDLIGELAAAVRKEGLKFGVSNHGMENFTFINPPAALEASLKRNQADLYDPAWSKFYNVADRGPAAMSGFLADWVRRNVELIDKYQPDLLWFDNGVNLRVLDPLKLQVAAYYYNRAAAWGKAVSISTKYVAYAPSNDDTRQIGSIADFEKIGVRSPAGIRPGPWMVDDVIGSTWGYTTGMTVAGGPAIVGRLVDTVSKGGFYLLNLSPTADGTIPDQQQRTLLQVGAWLDVNGEAIYGSRPWSAFGDGAWRFTARDGALYAIGMAPGGKAALPSLTPALGRVASVEQLGRPGALAFVQGAGGLLVAAGVQEDGAFPVVLKITGLK